MIEVHLHTILQRYNEHGVVRKLEVDIPDGNSLGDLLHHVAIDLQPDALLLVVNGRLVDKNYTLTPGDRVNLMPAISGG